MADGGPKRRLVAMVVEPDPDAPADVIGDEPIWHDGEVVGWVTSGGYGHHVEAVDRARLRARRSWRRPTARAAAASRSRSSAGAGRRGSSRSRCSTRRVSGCASDRGCSDRSSADRRRRPPVAFEAGDSVAIAIVRAGEVPGRRRDALPRRRLRQLPRRGRRHRLRPDAARSRRGPGRSSSGIPRDGKPLLPIVDAARPDAAAGRAGDRGSAGQVDVVVIGGGGAGRAAAAGRCGRPASRSSSMPATARRSSGSTRARRSSPASRTGCSTSRPTRSSSRPGAAEIQPVCRGQATSRGIVTARAAERLDAAGVDLGRGSSRVGRGVRPASKAIRDGRRRPPSSRPTATGVETTTPCDTAVVDLGRAPRDVLARMTPATAP